MALAPEAAEPLVRSSAVRVLVAVCLLLGAVPTASLLAVLLAWDGVWPTLAIAAGFASLTCAVLTATAVASGRWEIGAAGRWQRAGVLVLLLGAAATCAGGLVDAVVLLLQVRPYGTEPSTAQPSFFLAAAGAFALAVLLATAPLTRPRRRPHLRRTVVGAAVLGAVAAVSMAAAGAPDGCGQFDFQTERWRGQLASGGSRAVRMGRAVERCRVVEPGMTQARVRALLGRASRGSPAEPGVHRSLTWDLGREDGDFWSSYRLQVDFARSGDTTLVVDATVYEGS